MNIPNINIGFDYLNSYVIPKEIMKDPALETENILKLSLEYSCFHRLKGESKDYYLVYKNKESKRIAFRALKLQIASLMLVQAHYDLSNLESRTLYALIEEWSKIFGIPLKGLAAFNNVKEKITNDILKEVDYKLLPYYNFRLFDIKKYENFNKISVYDVRKKFRRS